MGLQTRDKNLKRKSNGGATEGRGKEKKSCGWMGVDEDEEDGEEEEGEIYSDMEEDDVVAVVVSDDQPGCSKSSPGVADQPIAIASEDSVISTTTSDDNTSSGGYTEGLSSTSNIDNESSVLPGGEIVPADDTVIDTAKASSENVNCGANTQDPPGNGPES